MGCRVLIAIVSRECSRCRFTPDIKQLSGPDLCFALVKHDFTANLYNYSVELNSCKGSSRYNYSPCRKQFALATHINEGYIELNKF